VLNEIAAIFRRPSILRKPAAYDADQKNERRVLIRPRAPGSSRAVDQEYWGEQHSWTNSWVKSG